MLMTKQISKMTMLQIKCWFFVLIFYPAICLSQVAQELFIASTDRTSLRATVLHPTGVPSNQPRPVVVALHGCGGLYARTGAHKGKLNARHAGMAQLLADHGYSIVFPDSFTARGETSLCSQKFNVRKIKQSHRSDDVDGVLLWLASQSWVDVSKIAMLGWSHGGSTVLRSTDATQQKVTARSVQPSLAIAFYPGCSDALKQNYRPHVPLVMMLAELDDWTPAGPCIQLAKNTGASFHVYPDSYHDFDNPVGNVRLRTDVPNGVNPGRGVHVGRNPVTGPQAWEQVLVSLQNKWTSTE
jgi:dienelactone hydrolase